MKWYDNEPELWVMIVTGANGSKAFSAGADLKEWLELQLYNPIPTLLPPFPHCWCFVAWWWSLVEEAGSNKGNCRKRKGKDGETMGPMIDGFCGISQRRGLKPMIAAVNGYAFGTSPLILLRIQIPFETSAAIDFVQC